MLTSLAVACTATLAPGAHAVSTTTATCADGNFFDGLDTRYAATYCYNSLDSVSYNPTKLSNTDALPALQQEPTDAVFYHAGHALVVGTPGNLTAVSSAFAGASSSDTTLTGLLGDPAAATIQGPSQVCDPGHGCRNVTIVNYPYVTQMTKFNLAVFQSCESARDGALGYQSLATVAYGTANVGTAIGWVTPVAWLANSPGNNVAGDAFARRFWSDLGNDASYSTALVAAVNAAGGGTYGYSGYRYLHHADVPTRLRGSGYYIPGGVL